jgi:hypothetical protein
MTPLLALALLAQPVPPAASQPDPAPPKEVRLARPVVEVPLLRITGRPAVEVFVEGKGPFLFGIETGARFVAIAPRVATSLGLEGEAFRVKEIAIGDASFLDLPAARARFADERIDGILGLALYEDLLLTLDFPAKKVRFERGALPAPDGKTLLPMTRAGPFWAVPVEVAGVPFHAILDTRGPGTLGVNPAAAAKLPFASPPAVVGTARGAAIAETPVRAGRLEGDLRLGALTFARPLVGIRQLPAHFPEEPLLGIEALEQMMVTLDQKSAVARFSRPAGPSIPPPPPLRSPGFRVRKEPRGPARIAGLRPGSAAAQTLREGDVVLEIAGKPPGDPEALRDLDRVPVVVERDGKRLEVEVAQVVIVQ